MKWTWFRYDTHRGRSTYLVLLPYHVSPAQARPMLTAIPGPCLLVTPHPRAAASLAAQIPWVRMICTPHHLRIAGARAFLELVGGLHGGPLVLDGLGARRFP